MKNYIVLLLVVFFIGSCINGNKSEPIRRESCIVSFRIESSLSPNPKAVRFRIFADDTLSGILLAEKWDSVLFHGGIFDTINFKYISIGVSGPDSLGVFGIGFPSWEFLGYKQDKLDSIALCSYEKLKVSIFYNGKVWSIKPCVSDTSRASN